MKPIGPAAAVDNATKITAIPSSPARVRSTRTPWATAVSSPRVISISCRPAMTASGSRTTSAITTGSACDQLRPLRLPMSQSWASLASSRRARMSRNALNASSIAATPMPTRISR